MTPVNKDPMKAVLLSNKDFESSSTGGSSRGFVCTGESQQYIQSLEMEYSSSCMSTHGGKRNSKDGMNDSSEHLISLGFMPIVVESSPNVYRGKSFDKLAKSAL